MFFGGDKVVIWVCSNMGQKIRHLNKLKEDNNKLKNEKIKACDDLARVIEQKDRLQRVWKRGLIDV